jgi:hypothetical protein
MSGRYPDTAGGPDRRDHPSTASGDPARTADVTTAGAGTDGSTDPVYGAARDAARLVWDYPLAVVAISVAWAFAAVPIVTLGPATVGAYAAVDSLSERGRVDRSAVLDTVRAQALHAVSLSLLPGAVGLIAVNYGLAYLATGATMAGLLALAGGYAALYLLLVACPTFVGLARGEGATDALVEGYLWTARHPIGAVAMGVVTGLLLLVTGLLTVAAVLLFGGTAATFHVAFVDRTTSPERQETPP